MSKESDDLRCRQQAGQAKQRQIAGQLKRNREQRKQNEANRKQGGR